MAKQEVKVEKTDKKDEKRNYLKPGEKVKLAKGDTPLHDRTEAPGGIMVGKAPKYL